jgi:hypothetical protein
MSALNTEALLLGQEGGGGYAIERSLRFNSADSAYLSRTPASAGNRKTWTWAGWVKKARVADEKIFAGGTSIGATTFLQIFFGSTGTLRVSSGSNDWVQTTQVFRDSSAWYHFVVALDTTQGTGSNRLKLYVNGVEITTFSTDNRAANISQNTDYGININAAHHIGSFQGSSDFFSGYLADVHFIDGQALDPTSFGEFSATTGVWVPKAYTGTYGTNGFRLDFADNSSNTATTLGKDTSPNGNNWTPNNLSVSNGNSAYLSSITESGTPYSSKSLAFDGNIATIYEGPPWTGYFDWSPSGLGLTGTVEIYANLSTNGRQYSVNGGAYVTPSVGWNTIADVSTITSIRFRAGTGISAGFQLNAIRINGIILVSSGAGNDSLVDVPTNGAQTDTGAGGEVRGNYCVLNPVKGSVVGAGGNTYVNFTLSNGNLDFSGAAGDNAANDGTIAVASGKWYWEVVHTGLDNQNESAGTYIRTNATSPGEGRTNGVAYQKSGNKLINNTSSSYGSSWTTSDVIGVALNLDTNEVTYYKNGVSQGAISFTPVNSTCAHLLKTNGTGAVTGSYNFGQRPFAYTAPSGFKALNTANLPAPLVTKPSTVMDVKLYTGNGSTQTISGLEFSPDLVWIKARSTSAYNHFLLDTVRGVNNELNSNTTDFEYTRPAPGSLTAFNSDGFALNTAIGVNASSTTYVAWTWDAGSSTVTNTQGSITSTVNVRANATAGFSIVTYAGTGVASTVGHGLGVVPGLIIVKDRTSGSFNWQVYHRTFAGTSNTIVLNSTAAVDTGGSGVWNSTTPTSTVFSIGTASGVNTNGNNYVAYCWAPLSGYSSFGSYVGNGSASDGPFVYTGFRPRWVMVKAASGNSVGGDGFWGIFDAARSGYNGIMPRLQAESSNQEDWAGALNFIDILSNGFKVRVAGTTTNNSGTNYIYAAFAEHPFQYARAR